MRVRDKDAVLNSIHSSIEKEEHASNRLASLLIHYPRAGWRPWEWQGILLISNRLRFPVNFSGVQMMTPVTFSVCIHPFGITTLCHYRVYIPWHFGGNCRKSLEPSPLHYHQSLELVREFSFEPTFLIFEVKFPGCFPPTNVEWPTNEETTTVCSWSIFHNKGKTIFLELAKI